MDECYAIRKKQAERMGTPEIVSDRYVVDLSTDEYKDVYVYDKYGRYIEHDQGSSLTTFTYYAGNLIASELSSHYNRSGKFIISYETKYEYSEDGSLKRRESNEKTRNYLSTSTFSYVYTGDMVLESGTDYYGDYDENTLYIDDYGYANYVDDNE